MARKLSEHGQFGFQRQAEAGEGIADLEVLNKKEFDDMPRPQFTLKTILWLMVVAAAFFAGTAWQRQRMIADGWSEPWEIVFESPQRPATQE